MQEEINLENKEASKQQKNEIPKEILVKLEGMGFEEKEDKPNLYFKTIGDISFFWDFRKTKKGNAYGTRDDNFLDKSEIEQMEEYLILKPEKKEKTEKKPSTSLTVPASSKKAVGPLRGSERDVVRLMDQGIQLDSIIEASSDKKKLGEGLLWHELKFGNRIHVEPSAELVDLISQDMGNISVKIVEFDTNILEDPNSGKKYMTYYCVAEATDGITHTSGLGAAEQIIDFGEIQKTGRTFSRTLAIRKASRNAIERLIPIPRKAMVYLIRKKLEEHAKQE